MTDARRLPSRARPFGVLAVTAAAALVALTSACNGSPAGPSNSAPFSVTDLRLGGGGTAQVGSSVTINYTGWLYDASKTDHKGATFDSSLGRTPLAFIVGNGDVIQGMDAGMPGMTVGGLRRLVIPPSQAYGGFRNNFIPPNATLIFDIELETSSP